jgi:hypothetical protein
MRSVPLKEILVVGGTPPVESFKLAALANGGAAVGLLGIPRHPRAAKSGSHMEMRCPGLVVGRISHGGLPLSHLAFVKWP